MISINAFDGLALESEQSWQMESIEKFFLQERADGWRNVYYMNGFEMFEMYTEKMIGRSKQFTG